MRVRVLYCKKHGVGDCECRLIWGGVLCKDCGKFHPDDMPTIPGTVYSFCWNCVRLALSA